MASVDGSAVLGSDGTASTSMGAGRKDYRDVNRVIVSGGSSRNINRTLVSP